MRSNSNNLLPNENVMATSNSEEFASPSINDSNALAAFILRTAESPNNYGYNNFDFQSSSVSNNASTETKLSSNTSNSKNIINLSNSIPKDYIHLIFQKIPTVIENINLHNLSEDHANFIEQYIPKLPSLKSVTFIGNISPVILKAISKSESIKFLLIKSPTDLDIYHLCSNFPRNIAGIGIDDINFGQGVVLAELIAKRKICVTYSDQLPNTLKKIYAELSLYGRGLIPKEQCSIVQILKSVNARIKSTNSSNNSSAFFNHRNNSNSNHKNSNNNETYNRNKI